MFPMPATAEAKLAIEELSAYTAEAAERAGSKDAKNPGNRVLFRWPPHPVSWEYNVHPTDWTVEATFEAHGETFSVQVARTANGTFGKCHELWLEARGEDLEDMLAELREASQPLFKRQLAVANCIGQPTRFTKHLRDLNRTQLLRLLFCEDRDVAHETRVLIESTATDPFWLPCLIFILNDRNHPYRRVAQWCVLDLFEALPTFAGDRDTTEAVSAMKSLIWDAEDDFARTVYKAGVVLGGHLPHILGGPTLLECLSAPSPIGRRAAIHGLYHVVEWIPEMKETVTKALQNVAVNDPHPLLRSYAAAMAQDILNDEADHVVEPLLENER